MNKTLRPLLAAVALALGSLASQAQYYEIANQLTNLVRPALSGSARYKGYVEISGLAGIGSNRASFAGVSTSQGFQYSDWFFMGAGLGVDLALAPSDDPLKPLDPDRRPAYWEHASSTTKAMIPVFSDFRFTLGGNGGKSTAAYIDLKIGATWLIGSSYLSVGDSRLGGGAQFYFKPSVGVRVPLSDNNPRQAVSFGLTYQLITSGNNYSWSSNTLALSALGASVAFEW